jgi:protein-L-isoaspartate(D-aspartate) O-methyltransferase
VDPRGAELRRGLVRELEARGSIRTEAVRSAFLSVPRELFLPEATAERGIEAVYEDEPIPTKFSRRGVPISSSSQPAIMAEMLERLGLEPGMRVLEVGAGTGYNAALLGLVVGERGRVDTVDVDADTARRARRALRAGGYRARVSLGDGRQGLPDHAPYERIVVTASSDTVPRPWFDQLVEGGRVVVPLRLREIAGSHVVASLEKTDRGFRSVGVVLGGFMPLRGDDDELPPSELRRLSATDAIADTPQLLAHLGGYGVARLSATARRRLLAVALTEPRRTRLPVGGRADGLVLYLSTSLAVTRLVSVGPQYGIGIATRSGDGFAYVEGRFSRRRRASAVLNAHGSPEPERELQQAIDAWERAGRPGADRLRLEVSYAGAAARIRRRWEPR